MGSETQWSLVRYDLKTAIDVLGFPCHVKLADDSLTDSKDGKFSVSSPTPSVVRLEKKICTCYVRARILPIQDEEWFIRKKGVNFCKQHERFVDKEILIPVECSTNVRLQDRDEGKQYRSVREVAEDFPRYVRVDQDTVCVSPGSSECQIVRKGSILELDRVTKAAQVVRGFRETYLICRQTDSQRELAFKLMSTVKFSKMLDTSAYLIKDLIERIPLPQTVDFLTTNPYDVISVSDEDSQNLLCILGGPVELISLKMREYMVGNIEDTNTVIAIPNEEDCLENTLVNIPFSGSRKSTEFIDLKCDVRSSVGNSTDYEHLLDKLYLAYFINPSAVVLHAEMTPSCTYDVTDDPFPPSLPARSSLGGDRNSEKCTLQHTISDPAIAGRSASRRTSADARKRIVSTGDLERKTGNQQRRQDSRRFKAYLSQFSRRMKTTASHFLFGVQDQYATPSDMTSLRKEHSSANQKLQENATSADSNDIISQSSFVCYVDEGDTFVEDSKSNTSVVGDCKFYFDISSSDRKSELSNRSVYVPYSQVIKMKPPVKGNNNHDLMDRNSQTPSPPPFNPILDSITINQTTASKESSAEPEVVYARVNKPFKRSKDFRPAGCCEVCKQIVTMDGASLQANIAVPSLR